MNCVFRNKYYPSGLAIARLSVCAAALIWSLIVLLGHNALDSTLYGHLLTHYIPENVYGWFFLALASVQLYRLLWQRTPHRFGVGGYAILAGACSFVLVFWLLYQRPLHPTALASLVVVTALSFYAFIGSARRDVQ